MKIIMSVWITEDSNILSYEDVIANKRYQLHWAKIIIPAQEFGHFNTGH